MSPRRLQDAFKTPSRASKTPPRASKTLQDASKTLLWEAKKPRFSLCFSRFSMSRACLELSWPDMASKTTSRAPGTLSTASKTPSRISQTAPKASKTPPRASKMLPRHVPEKSKNRSFHHVVQFARFPRPFLGDLRSTWPSKRLLDAPKSLQCVPKTDQAASKIHLQEPSVEAEAIYQGWSGGGPPA